MSAIAAIHARGLVHRDVKLKNILVQENPFKFILTDFSLCKKIDF